MADSTTPTVSVIIPAYNAAAYLGEAVSSALSQSFTDLEVIVVDDGSTDETPNVIASFGDRVRSVRQENGGVAEALNTGIGMARGRYVRLLAADDVFTPESTATVVRLLDANPDASFVHGAAYEIDETGDLLDVRIRGGKRVMTQRSREAVIQLLRRNTVVCSTVTIRKSYLDEVGGFRQECMPGEDWEMWLRLAANHSVVYTREILARYRIHGDSLTSKFELASYKEAHLRTLKSLFDEGRIGQHQDLRSYAFAAHLRTMASMAAYLGKPVRSLRYLSRAIIQRPQLVFELQSWATLYHGVKAALPAGAVRAGRAIKARLRRTPSEFSQSEKPAS